MRVPRVLKYDLCWTNLTGKKASIYALRQGIFLVNPDYGSGGYRFKSCRARQTALRVCRRLIGASHLQWTAADKHLQ